ncbi:MAG: hypothetical protein WBM44_02920 [Waterburya sp.]
MNCRQDVSIIIIYYRNQVVVLEDLNVKGMVRNHKLASSISDYPKAIVLNVKLNLPFGAIATNKIKPG